MTEYNKRSFSVDMGVREQTMSGDEIQTIADKDMKERRDALFSKEEQEKKVYQDGLAELLGNCPFVPLNDRILVYPELVGSFDKKTSSGLIVIDSVKKNAKKATNKGTVLAVGPGLKLVTGEFIDVPVVKGEVVMYEQFGYSEVFINDKMCHVCRAGDILGKADSAQAKGLAGF